LVIIKKYIVPILLSVLFINTCFGQSKKNREDFLYGEYYLAQGQYDQALSFYMEAYQDMKDNSNINYRIGQCYMKIIGQQLKAIDYLEVAVKEIDLNYVDGRFKNTGAPKEAWLLLGDAFKLDNKLLEASYAYHQYRSYLSSSDKKEMELINEKIRNVGISYEMQRDTQKVEMENIGNMINTRFSDYNFVLSGNRKVLVYTSYWESYDRIMYSFYSDGCWAAPRDITDEIGSEGDCYSAALSYDGTKLFIVKMGRYNSDIFSSEYREGKWTKMKPLNNKINSNNQESSISISSDGNTLYFSSDRPGGVGDFDIYSATKENNDWNNVKNLGKPINTSGREEAPYITIDGITLFFCSNDHEGLGRMDIYYSDLNLDNTWGEPENMGPPYNTTEDDLFFIYFKKDKIGFTSRDMNGGYGKNDIYVFQAGKSKFKFNECSKIANQSLPDSNNLNTGIISSQTPSGEVIDSEKPGIIQDDVHIEDNSITNLSETDSSVKEKTQQVFVESDETQDVLKKNNNENIPQTDAMNIELHTLNPDDSNNNQITENPVTSELSSDAEFQEKLSGYTIQIMALYHPVEITYFGNVNNVRMIKGNDGFHRYIAGYYDKYHTAKEKLKEIRKLGYHDAFIRELNSIPNIQ
jgi:tetratricopeptide (TPR) repeat protein